MFIPHTTIFFWFRFLCSYKENELAARAKHQVMKYQTDWTSADEPKSKADYSNVVGDRRSEPKNLPSGPTLFQNTGDALPSCTNHRVFFKRLECKRP